MECPFVFSSSAEIPVFCPREQCPLHVFSLEVVSPERLPAGLSIAWRFSGNSTKVTVFPKNTWTDTPLSSFPLPFVCPYLLSSCFIYLFIFLSFFHTPVWSCSLDTCIACDWLALLSSSTLFQDSVICAGFWSRQYGPHTACERLR